MKKCARKFLVILAVLALIPATSVRGPTKSASAAEIIPVPPSNAGAVPTTFFFMHIQSAIFSGMPWPSVSIGGIGLWDTFTNWNNLNPSRGVYDWTILDKWLNLAQQQKVDVLYTFGGTPTWASSNPTATCDYNRGACYPPANLRDWDNFVRALATHAAGKIKYWELWNEADEHEYWSGSIQDLVIMGQHAHDIIKSIDPTTTILTPSAAGAAADIPSFLDSFFASGGGAFVDAVAFHGYGNANPSVPEEVNGTIDAIKNVMNNRGQGSKPL